MSGAGNVKIRGSDAFLRRLTALVDNDVAIARAGVASGLSVYARAARNAAPGSVKQECGMFVRVSGEVVWGRAGLMRFPRSGDGQDGPHGVYLEHGTKNIAARHMIGNAIRAASPMARMAVRIAAKRRIQRQAAIGR